MMSDKDKMLWYWGNCEEHFNGGFETKDQAISDAYGYRAECFDDPSEQSGFYLLHGKLYDNPDYDEEWPYNEENSKHLITGKPEYIDALDVTDLFYDAWKNRTAEIAKRDRAIEVLMSFAKMLDGHGFFHASTYIAEAQAILGEPFAATPEKGQVDVDDLAQFIRKVNGSSQMGAGVLAEHIVEYLHTQNMLKNPRKVNT